MFGDKKNDSVKSESCYKETILQSNYSQMTMKFVISETCYKETTLQSNYRKMTMKRVISESCYIIKRQFYKVIIKK